MTELSDQPAKSRKGVALAAGGAVLAVAAVGGGIWGYQAFYGQGDQPAQALPVKGLLGYVALDASPNGEQLLEARSTLKKFPGLADQVELGGKEDLRKTLFEKLQEDGTCEDLDYGKQVAPWLGDRMGLAAIDAGKGVEPEALLVFQTTDTDKAEKALPAVLDCLNEGSAADSALTSHAFSGDWLVLGEEKGSAKKAVDAAADASLADDEHYAEWTDAAGDPGILTAYASPLGYQRFVEWAVDDADMEMPKAIKEEMDAFTGAGLVGRFRDGAFELEAASRATENVTALGDTVTSLPSSTVAAFAFVLPEGWLEDMIDAYAPLFEEEVGMSVEDAEAELKSVIGIDFEDIETLFGEGVALAVDSEIDGDAIQEFDLSAVPVALKIKGDTDEIEKILDTLRTSANKQLGMPRDFVTTKTSGDYVIVSTNADYADKLADEKGLGKSSSFKEIVPDAEGAASTLFVDFDVDNWLDDLLETFGAPEDVLDNVEPLSGIGLTSWADGDDAHVRFRLTTD